MIGRKAIVGLSLLCALMFCALAAQGASATASKNTTAFTCVPKEKGDFKDAHCDTKVPAGEGKFAHEEIALNVTTELTTTNEGTAEETKKSTPAILRGEVGGAKSEIICSTVHNAERENAKKEIEQVNFLHNVEPVAKEHKVTGETTTNFTNCTVNKPKVKEEEVCIVEEPIKTVAVFEGVDELEGKKEMGLEFRPPVGTIFTPVKFLQKPGAINACILAGVEANVEGTAIATGTPGAAEKHSGATLNFTAAMTSKTLTFGKKPAEFIASFTTRMAPIKGVTQNPISLTTTT